MKSTPNRVELCIDPGDEPPNEKPCEGWFFRGIENHYFNGTDLVSTKRLRKLKRKSCSNPGCPTCDWLHEIFIYHHEMDYQDMSFVEQGKLYQLVIVPHRDWESGIVDDYEIEFEERQDDKHKEDQ